MDIDFGSFQATWEGGQFADPFERTTSAETKYDDQKDNDNDELDEFAKETDEVVKWRLDPEYSFSDWTIRLFQSAINENRNSDAGENNDIGDEEDYSIHGSTATTPKPVGTENNGKLHSEYHVHRSDLTIGYRKSEYFQAQFAPSTNTQESLSRTTEFFFPESACLAFPRFLDYIYDTSKEIGPTRDERTGAPSEKDCREEVGLAFLADYLRVPRLMCLAKRRIQHVLKEQTVVSICREALVYNIEWIIDDCIRVAARDPSESKTSPYQRVVQLLPLGKRDKLREVAVSNLLREREDHYRRYPSLRHGAESPQDMDILPWQQYHLIWKHGQLEFFY